MGGRRREPWWRQTAARKQLSTMLEDILAAARARCWESGRCGKGGGVRDLAEYNVGSNGPRYAGMDTGDARLGK